MAFLDETGLTELVAKIKAAYAAKSHTHAASDITSGTLAVAYGGTGATTAAAAWSNLHPANTTRTVNQTSATDTGFAVSSNGTTYIRFIIGSGMTNSGIYDNRLSKWALLCDGSTVQLNGNAATATALSSSAGSSSVPVYFSGGKPYACTMSKSGSWTGLVTAMSSAGVMEIGPYIDFHSSVTSTNDYDARLSYAGSWSITSPASFRSAIQITSGTSSPSSSGSAGAIYIKYAS